MNIRWPNLSLHHRLNLLIALTVLLIVGGGVVVAVSTARRSVRAELDSTINLALQLIDAGMQEYAGDPAALQAWLTHIARIDRFRHLRIYHTDATALRPPPPDAPPSRPIPGWFVRAVTPPARWAERQIVLPHTAAATIWLVADPADEITEAWGEMQNFFMLMGFLALAVYGLIHATLGRSLAAVSALLGGLAELRHGRYHVRLPRFASPEFAQIADAFNEAAAALADARAEARVLRRRAFSIQEEERRHLARELHDELAQSLTAVKLSASRLQQHSHDPATNAALETIIGHCDRLFAVVRSMMRSLRPMLIDDLGLTAALEDLVEQQQRWFPILAIQLNVEPAIDQCSDAVKTHLYRIAQESLTNAARHANARRLSLQVTVTPDRNFVRLVASDDGSGFDPMVQRPGPGLAGIRERAESLGGTFQVHTAPGAGMRLEVTLPCHVPDEAALQSVAANSVDYGDV